MMNRTRLQTALTLTLCSKHLNDFSCREGQSGGEDGQRGQEESKGKDH
jgi:hypothetical protein